MRTVRALARAVAYMTILAVVVLVPHMIAYAVVPLTEQGGISNAFPACITEDSHNCYWDANVQGNGQGNSFLDINGTAYYAE